MTGVTTEQLNELVNATVKDMPQDQTIQVGLRVHRKEKHGK